MYDFYWKEKREPEQSIIRFSVQLFTLIPVAEHVCQNTEILSTIFGKIVSLLEPKFDAKAGLKFVPLRGFDYNKFAVLIHDALQLLRNLNTDCHESVMDISILDPLIYSLFMLSNMELHVRKTGEHVEFERNNYDSANYICFEMQKIVREVVRFAVSSSEIHLIWTLLDKYTSQSSFYQYLLKEEKLTTPIYQSKRSCTFFGSLSWFWGSLIAAAQEKGTLKSLSPPLKLLKLFAKDSLLRLIFSAEVRSNLWVRNGSIVLIQDYFYCKTVFHDLTFVPDVYNCIVLASFMDLDAYIKFLVDQSALFAYFEEADQNVAVIEQILVILLSAITITPPSIDHDQIIINALCSGGHTRSSLTAILPDAIVDLPSFRKKVFSLASLKAASTLGTDSTLEAKSEAQSRFDPFYWAFPMDARMKAWVSMCQEKKFSFATFTQAFRDRYQPAPNVSLAYQTISVILSHLLKIDSSKYEFAIVATLFCILMLPESFFDEANQQQITKAVYDLKSKASVSTSLAKLLQEFEELFCRSHRKTDEAPSESSSKSVSSSARDRKAALMAKFKNQRAQFITENVAEETKDETSFVCVVCSGTSCSDENRFCLPIQLNPTTLTHGTGLKDQSMLFIKGCCHVLHQKCFENLARRRNTARKCPLCGAQIDFCIQLSANSNEETINLTSLTDLLVSEDEIMDTVDVNEAQLEPIGEAYVDTVVYLALRKDKFISPQLISTLNSVRKEISDARFDQIQDMPISEDQPSFIRGLKQILKLLIQMHQKKLDVIKTAQAIKKQIAQFAFVKSEDQQERFNECLNFALHMFIHGAPPLNEQDSTIIARQRVSVAENIPSNLMIDFNFTDKLIDLPDRYDELLRQYLKKKCKECRTVPRSAAICLHCGELLCMGDSCCPREQIGIGECNAHGVECSNGTGLYFLLRKCAILMLSTKEGLIIPAPYLNAYGEHDMDLRSESPLTLNHHLYYTVLASIWSNYEIRDYISRNEEGSRLTATAWHLL